MVTEIRRKGGKTWLEINWFYTLDDAENAATKKDEWYVNLQRNRPSLMVSRNLFDLSTRELLLSDHVDYITEDAVDGAFVFLDKNMRIT